MEKKEIQLAKLFHDTYERLAPEFGYTTREDTKEFNKDSPNGKLMVAVCKEVMTQELDKAREEGRREVYEAIVFDKNIPHDVTTFVAANLWKNMRDKAKEELSKLTTK